MRKLRYFIRVPCTEWGRFKDIANGRTPGEFSGERLFRTFAMSGFGGAAMSILASGMMGKRAGFYGPTIFGDFMHRWSRVIGEDEGEIKLKGYNLVKALQHTSGVGRLWYTQAVTDALIREAILSKNEIARINKWYEENLGSSIYLR